MKGPRLPDSVYADPGGPRRFVAASLPAGIRYSEQRSFQGRNSLPMVSFRRTYTLPDIASSFLRQRGLPAGGAYWPEGSTGQRGLLVSGGGFGPGGLPLGYAPDSNAVFQNNIVGIGGAGVTMRKHRQG